MATIITTRTMLIMKRVTTVNKTATATLTVTMATPAELLQK